MIRPKGKKNGLIFDDHQRIELRILARFSDPYLCIPRGTGKTLLDILYLYFLAIFYPRNTIKYYVRNKRTSS